MYMKNIYQIHYKTIKIMSEGLCPFYLLIFKFHSRLRHCGTIPASEELEALHQRMTTSQKKG